MDRCAIVDAAAYERIPDKYKSDHSSMSFVEAAFAGNFKFPAMTLTSGGTSKQLKLGGQATENLLVALRNVIPSHPASVTFTLADINAGVHRRFVADLLLLDGQHSWAISKPLRRLSWLDLDAIDLCSDDGVGAEVDDRRLSLPAGDGRGGGGSGSDDGDDDSVGVEVDDRRLSLPAGDGGGGGGSGSDDGDDDGDDGAGHSGGNGGAEQRLLQATVEHLVGEHRGAQQRLVLLEGALRAQSLQALLHQREASLLAAELKVEEAVSTLLRVKVQELEDDRRRERKKKSELTAHCAALEMALDAATHGVLAERGVNARRGQA